MSTKRALCIVLVASIVVLAMEMAPARIRTLAQQIGAPGDSGLAVATSAVGFVDGAFVIGDEAVDTVTPAVAYNSQRQEYLVVWWNDRPGCDDIYGRRVSRSGVPLGARFFIAAGCPTDRQLPDVAYNSQANEYLVVWEEATVWGNIVGQRIPATGGTTGSQFTVASGSPSYPRYYQPAIAYASTANKYLVVSQSYSPTTGYSIMAQALNSDGTAWGAGFDIESISASRKFYPDLAYNHLRNEFLVVWGQHNPGQYDIRGRRVKMAGGAGTLGSAFWFSCDSSRDDVNPAVAAVPRSSSSGQYLVAWQYWSNLNNYDIWAQQVTGGGTLEGTAFMVFNSPKSDLRPAVAGSNSNQHYLVAWTTVLSSAPFAADIYVRSIATDGSKSSTTWSIGAAADNSAVASGPAGDMLIAYDDAGSSGRDIWGVLWGNRVYLPLMLRDY